MKVLMLSLDKTLFEASSDVAKRMIAYAALAEQTFIIVFNHGRNFSIKKLADNLTVYPINSSFRFFYFLDALKLARKIKKENNFNLISVQDPYLTGLIGCILAKLLKVKLLVGVFGTDIFNKFWLKESWIRYFLKPIGLFVLGSADAVQTDNPDTAEFLKQKYGSKVFWKPIVPSAIESYKNAVKIPSDFFRILTVVRLVKQKNLPMLLKVMEELFKSSVAGKIKFTLVGDGPLRKYVETELKRKNLSDKVDWTQGCSWNKLIDYYRQADLFMLTSFYEGFPRVFQEAMAVGLPIVTANVGEGLVKNNYNGFVIEQNNITEFVEKVIYLINHQDKLTEFSENSKKYFWDNFSFEKTLEIQKEIYSYLSVN